MAKFKFGGEVHPGFHAAVKARVAEHFDRTGRSRYGDWRLWTKVTAFAAIVILCYAAIFASTRPTWSTLAAAIAFGVSSLLLAMNVAHDASHHALTPWRRFNRLAHFITFIPIGINDHLWAQRHIRSHHVFPNVPGSDIDAGENAFIRLSPHHRWRPIHRWQHLYAPLIYVLVLPYTVFVQDPVYLFKRELANMDNLHHPVHEHILFWIHKALHFTLVLGVPLLILEAPWWMIVAGWLATALATSGVFVTLLIGTHFAEETAFPAVGGAGRLEHDWATHAMVTSLDWSPESRLACTLVGGANTHAAHHLCPTVCHVHCPEITEIIRQTAAEFGVRYNRTSFAGMIGSHFRFLGRMGRVNDPLAAWTPMPTAEPSAAG
jgi:linoleoyl-CoA desaturase